MTSIAGRTERIWFLDTLVLVRVASSEGGGRTSVLEHHAPHGDSPPLHVHRTEDEIFHVLEGELLLQLDGERRRAGPGEILLAPRGVPHTYRVESAAGARWLTITSPGDFEAFVRAVGRPAERDGLPDRSDGPPPPEAVEALAAVAERHEIELVGPPLH